MQDTERPRIEWRLIIAVWMLPTIADVADTYIVHRVSGTPWPPLRVIALISPAWLSWILFTPLIFWFGARVRIGRPWRVKPIATHLLLSVLVGLAHDVVLTTASQLFDPRRHMTAGARFAMTVQDWLPISMLLYFLTLIAGYALEGARRERAQALRTTELEGQLARSELAVLREQLHPHFLFNALNTAVSLVRAKQPEAGVQVLTHLADLLRQLVHGVEQEVPLRDELRMLDSYLEIERARFGSRLTIDVNVPAALQDAYVPGLVLQPLVENALRHGVGKRDSLGHVSVDAIARGDTLELRVRDDGPGFALDAPASDPPGVGIANTRARLSRLYGDAGTLSLHNGATGGAEVIVSLPIRHAPVHAASA
ncbi:MAG TPA: histidine kinase [Gemmatimonadaceae bacterium]|nr:histidine kinase [Gemmatimonadaceae bacterium]